MHDLEGSIYDRAISLCTVEQQEFINNMMRRGKRTAWLNALAAIKGIVVSPYDDEETIAQKIGGWILYHYEDFGARQGKCECGQAIRYAYHVVHVETGDELTLGSTCIERYTGLDANTVAAIIKGMKVIDLEREEILRKIIAGWKLSFEIPAGLELPSDIQQHLDLQLPLLDRQITRLKKLVDNYNREQRRNDLFAGIQGSIDLLGSDESEGFFLEDELDGKRIGNKNEKVPNYSSIPESWANKVNGFIQHAATSGIHTVNALEISNWVAKVFGFDQDRYLTGKPRTYYLVARYLDSHPQLEVVNGNTENIWYRVRVNS
ncbi:hypothetical protein [Brevibacillus marinus]|uniref:hypothetical protein n=1 Tax=Brevibacillus marinus TaxID=2496837 RepID=UPI000F82273C|nr:hypothetical protein [Brevibacillus marinus]